MRDVAAVTQLGVWGHDRGTEQALVRKISFLLGSNSGLRAADLPRALLLIIGEHLRAGNDLNLSYLIDLLGSYGYYGDWLGGESEQDQLLALLFNQQDRLVAC